MSIRRAPLSRRALSALVALVLFGCGSDPAQEHLETARELLADGESSKALLAYNNAIELSPNDADIYFEFAQTLSTLGHFGDARFYYDEAYRLDPTMSRAAVARALLTSGGNPAAARQIVEAVLAERPDDAWGHLGMSQLLLEQGDTDAAFESATRAIESDDGLAEAYTQLGRVYQARIALHFADLGVPPADVEFEAALKTLERATESGAESDRPWRATIERARIYSLWPGHEAEAEETFREGYAQAEEGGAFVAQRRAAERAADYARRVRNGELLGWALERQVEIRPRDTGLWESLALSTANRGGSYESVLRDRLEKHPDDPGAHISYATWLARERGLDEAEAYLAPEIESPRTENHASALLAALVRIQSASGEPRRAVETAQQLSSRFPDSRPAIVMSAWRSLQQRRPDLAVSILSEHRWVPEDLEALTLLVDSHSVLGNVEGEVAALTHALEQVDRESVLGRRIEARIAYRRGEFRKALSVFQQLRGRKAPLSEPESVWFAKSAYESDLPQVGRSVLLELVETETPSLSATSELARREYGHPVRLRIARKAFDLILAAQPQSRRAIFNAFELELAANEPDRAIERLRAGIASHVEDPERATDLRVRLAKALDETGRRDEARKEAWIAFEARPEHPPALPTLVSLYEDEAAQEIARRGNTIGGGLTPTEHAFVGRLHELTGNERLARWSFEQALNGDVDIPILRNDLAYLLAKQKTDLDRALRLARQAAQKLGSGPPVLDTIGYVLLAQGETAEAERSFDRAISLARAQGLPTETYEYHRALAMRDSGRTSAAVRLIQSLLEREPDFEEADEAQRTLKQMDRQRVNEERRKEYEERREEMKKRREALAAERAKEAATEAGEPDAPTTP